MNARHYMEKLALQAPALGAEAKAVHHMLQPEAAPKANALKAFKPVAPPQNFSRQFGPAAKLAALRRKCTCGGKGTCVSCRGSAWANNAPDHSEGDGLRTVSSVAQDERDQETGKGQPAAGRKKHAGIFHNTAERLLRERAPTHGWRTALGAFGGASLGVGVGAEQGRQFGRRQVDDALRDGRPGKAAWNELFVPMHMAAHGVAGGSIGMVGGTTIGLLAERRAAQLHAGRVSDLTNAMRAGTAAAVLGGSYAAYRHSQRRR